MKLRVFSAFVFENDEIILGASSPEAFRKALEGIRNRTYVNPII